MRVIGQMDDPRRYQPPASPQVLPDVALRFFTVFALNRICILPSLPLLPSPGSVGLTWTMCPACPSGVSCVRRAFQGVRRRGRGGGGSSPGAFFDVVLEKKSILLLRPVEIVFPYNQGCCKSNENHLKAFFTFLNAPCNGSPAGSHTNTQAVHDIPGTDEELGAAADGLKQGRHHLLTPTAAHTPSSRQLLGQHSAT